MVNQSNSKKTEMMFPQNNKKMYVFEAEAIYIRVSDPDPVFEISTDLDPVF